MENMEVNKEEVSKETREEAKDIQKVYIKNYGNLTLEIRGTNEIGMSAYSAKRDEELFIPWTSIIMVSNKIN